MRLSLLLAALALVQMARAEPPPLIAPIQRAVVPAEPAINPEPLPDGPMCEGYSAVPVPLDPPLPSRLGVLLEAPISDAERIEVETQIERCARSVGKVADPWLVLALYRLESDLGVPPEALGILGATWCWESAMRTSPRSGDVGRSHGAFQMQDWLWEWCGARGPTMDVLDAATCYWSRVADRFESKGRRCPERARWRVSEALTANGPKYASHGCKAESLHWEELQRWRKASP